MNADGSRFRQLTVTPVKFHNYQPAWSRDGLSIAFGATSSEAESGS
jgi:hypothetical protein